MEWFDEEGLHIMELGETLELLKKFPLFDSLQDTELDKIARLLIRRALVDRMIVFMQGEPLEYVYFICEGKVKIYRTDEQGREQIVNVLQEGDFFPHRGFFQPNAAYPAHSVMMEKGVLLALPVPRFRALLETHPSMCLKLLAIMERKLSDIQGRLEEMVLHDTFGRLVLLLIRLARLHGEQCGTKIRLTVQFTNQELANMIGTSRETVSRTLSQLRKAGAVTMGDCHHILLDLDKLERQMRV